MKKILFSLLSFLLVSASFAQTHIRVWQNGDDNRMKIASVGDMTFSGDKLTIGSKQYGLNQIDSIVVVPEVTVQYQGGTATVNIPASVGNEVTANVQGAHVVLNNLNTKNEIEVVLSGESSDGSFTYNGQFKATFVMNGLSLKSSKGAAIDIQCGKRCALELVEGTTNTLTDAVNGNQKACLYCKGHLEVSGAGTLNVTSQSKHAIATKEYLQLKKSTGTVNILKAASDAIHCGQYFQMNGGVVNVDENTIGDGIQVETLTLADGETPDPSEENNGQIIIKGGTIKQTISHQDCKGLKCDGAITVSGGSIDILASGNGSRGIQTDGKMTVNEADAKTTITVNATGGKCTLAECEDDPHRCVGMKLGGLLLQAGTITVKATGSKSRSVQVPAGGYVKTGGTATYSPAITEK